MHDWHARPTAPEAVVCSRLYLRRLLGKTSGGPRLVHRLPSVRFQEVSQVQACRVVPRTTLCEVARARMCGTWLLLDRIGGGGNGDVYRSRGTGEATDGMEAAVKILKRSRAARRERISRFRNEVDFLVSREPPRCPATT